MCSSLHHHMTRAVSLVATAWVPDSPIKAVAGGIAWWYGRQVALTYLPGIISQYLIDVTAANISIGGTVLGVTVVAPLFTPGAVYWLSLAAACASFYIAVVVYNVAERFICNPCCAKKAKKTQSSISKI